MTEYAIENDITGLIVDSFTSEELAFQVMCDYAKTGMQCSLHVFRRG